jgi:coenzyme F420-0:L-glutamate ligase/coenzyme F420-1:gamma-L-glutamate ligase
MARAIQVIGIEGLPEVRPGDDLVALVLQALAAEGLALQDGDILVLTQKVVSKAEGRMVALADVEPSAFARTIARQMGRDPRFVEVVLRQARRIVRMDRHVLVVETPQGFVCANAGVDRSNVGEGRVVLLPADPDASARAIRREIKRRAGVEVAVLITDTFGRPWREGLTEVAIGVAGLAPLKDYRGQQDRFGVPLQATVVAVADELACAAGLVMEKLAGVPAAIIRGYAYEPQEGAASALVRPPERDLFR